MEDLIQKATKNLGDVIREAIRLAPTEQVIVLFDAQAPLTRILTEAYRRVLSTATFVDFDVLRPEQILEMINLRQANDLVILIQSTNFRLSEFRIRIELFKRDLKTIEHTHLGRMAESEYEPYIDALAYDPSYYRPLGRSLKERLDNSSQVIVECKDTRLVYETGMEDTKLNIGDYTGMKNVGGTFPIGEVFTEPKDLRAVNGQARIYAFAGEDHFVRTYEPFIVDIKDGILTAPQAPQDLQAILEKVRLDEETLVREFGLGLNPAMGKDRLVADITAFERQLGLHFSIGAKHAMYPKPGLKRKEGRYHVDVFVDVERILVDGKVLFENGKFVD